MSEEPEPPHAAILRQFGLGEDDQAAWERSGLADDEFEEWLTDRVARRPAGRRAREVYGADDVHDFARRAILDALSLGPGGPAAGRRLRRGPAPPRRDRARFDRERNRPQR